MAPRPAPVHSHTTNDVNAGKPRPQQSKRMTWSNGPSNVAPMPILPTIRPISPISDTATAQATNNTRSVSFGSSGKIGRQLSVKDHYDAEAHRKEAERALNGQSGLISPPISQKESFFSHLRKRARRFSGRHQTPITPTTRDLEAQVGCGPWQSNRSSMVIDKDSLPTPNYKVDTHEALDKALRVVKNNLDGSATNSGYAPVPPAHQINPAVAMKRNPSLHQHQQTRSADNLNGAVRASAPISSRTRRSQAVVGGPRNQYETPDEEEELLDEALTSAQRAMKRLDRNSSQDLLMTGCNDQVQGHRIRQSQSKPSIMNPYPTPSPTANGNAIMFNQGLAPTSHAQQDHNMQRDQYENRQKWQTTPPYNDNDWSDAAVASIWAAGNRF